MLNPKQKYRWVLRPNHYRSVLNPKYCRWVFNRFSFCFHLFFSLINARHQICHSSFLRVHSNSFSLVFFLCSASPLKVTIAKLRMVSVIHLPAFFWILHADFLSFLRKKDLFGVGYPVVLYILKQLRRNPSGNWVISGQKPCTRII